MASVVVLLTF